MFKMFFFLAGEDYQRSAQNSSVSPISNSMQDFAVPATAAATTSTSAATSAAVAAAVTAPSSSHYNHSLFQASSSK